MKNQKNFTSCFAFTLKKYLGTSAFEFCATNLDRIKAAGNLNADAISPRCKLKR